MPKATRANTTVPTVEQRLRTAKQSLTLVIEALGGAQIHSESGADETDLTAAVNEALTRVDDEIFLVLELPKPALAAPVPDVLSGR